MPLAALRCPYCDRPIELLDDRGLLVDGEWWHADCWDDSEDAPYWDEDDDE